MSSQASPGARGASRTGLRSIAVHVLELLGRFPVDVLQLMFRIAIAVVFFRSGLTKIASWDSTVALFQEEYRVPLLPPETAAYMAAAFELSCSALLALGLASRLATLPLLGMTLVIQTFVYPEHWSEHLTWLALLLFILTRGPGALSLDRLLARLLIGRR